MISGLPLSATNDRLSQAFPVYKSNLEAIDLSPAVRSFLDSLSRSRSLNCQDDVLFGQARLAVRPSSNLHGEGCNYCGLCLSGCVYNAIYSANDELARLERAGKVEYRPGDKVLRLKERGDRIEVTCQTAGGSRETIFFDKVFLAAGAINSTRIILASNRAFDRRVIMKTTQGFVIPMLRLRGDPFVWPSANTLAGVFLEFKVPEVSNHWVHSQINLANELVMARLDFQPERGRWRDHVLMPAFKRLFVAICNFHSDHAGTHELVLREGTDGGMDSLLIETRASDTFRRVAKRGLRRFVRIMSRVGVLPLIPLMHGSYEKPWGWHFGGTLPMSANPQGDLETDFLGRPTGWTRVHVVDSSVFPSIPATTVALLAMANARRIASTARLDETSDVTVHSASSGRW